MRENHSHQVGEDDHVLELARQPDQVEGVLVDRNFVGKRGGIVTAQPAATVGRDANAEVSDTSGEACVAGDVGDGVVHVVVDLCRVGDCFVVLIVDGEEEDAGDEWR